MGSNDWYQIGEEIKRQVQNAIDTNDFTELSKSISETAGLAMGDVSKSLNNVSQGINNIGKNINTAMNDAADSLQKGIQQATNSIHNASLNRNYVSNSPKDSRIGERQKWERYNGKVYYGKPNLRPDPKLFNNTPAGSVSGIVWLIAGLGIASFGGLATLQGAISVLIGSEAVTALALPATAATTGLAVSAYGVGIKNRADRFKRYVDIVKDKLYCSVEELADRTGKSMRYVRRDLKRMMDKNMFLQGHLDKKESTFIASDAMYDQYLLTQKQYEEKFLLESKEEKNTKKKRGMDKDSIISGTENGYGMGNSAGNAATTADGADDKVSKVLQEGREYIAVIRKCNDDIPGEEMSRKLDKLEFLVSRIFARVEEEPSLAPDMQKLLRYYLPTTQKLLEAYRGLDKQDVQVKNISDTKMEIERTVDTINMACEGILDDLFRDHAWDIQSDITVLNTMLKQDGYIKSDFDKGEKEQ